MIREITLSETRAQRPAAQKVEVEVGDQLAAIGAGVRHQAVAGSRDAQLAGKLLRYHYHMAGERGVIGF